MNFLAHSTFKIVALLSLLNISLITGTTTVGITANPASEPHYRFHYIVKDEKTGDYKSQEERRNGDSVTGSYTVAEPNGDLRVVNYVADVSSGFKADVNVQPGASPVKVAVANAFSPSLLPKDAVIGLYQNHRTGISAPPKHRKPTRGFHPIVVKSLSYSQTQPQLPTSTSEPSQPYLFYKEAKNESTLVDTSSTGATKKSVHVDPTFGEPAPFEKTGNVSPGVLEVRPLLAATSTDNTRNADLQSSSYLATENNAVNTVKTTPSANGLYQLRNMDIPSSVMEILNQNKAKSDKVGDAATATGPTVTLPTTASAGPLKTLFYETASLINTPAKIDLGRTENVAINESSKLPQKGNVPQRPMRLIGLSPIYVDNAQLQTITENLTSIPQLHLEPLSNIQYATPAPFYQGPLPGGPAGPFRNVPRSVNDPNVVEVALYNTMPLMNSIPISAPIIAGGQPASGSGLAADAKPEAKLENKLPLSPLAQSTLPLCSDCFLTSNYVPYPIVKVSAASPAAAGGNHVNGSGNGVGGNQKTSPCASTNAAPPPAPTQLWPPYTPSFAYILMPTPILKSKSNETRPLVTNIWSK